MFTTVSEWLKEQSYLECVVCGSELYNSGTSCTSCLAPLELSRTVANRGVPGKMVSVLGASGAGKTVYLGMLLDILSKGHASLRGLPNGAFSLAVQELTVRSLEQQRFPEKTASEPDRWNWVHCEAFHPRRPKECVDLITPDLAGEALALELEQANTYSTIQNLIHKSKGILVLFDSQRVRDAGRCEDMFGVKLLTYISSQHSLGKKERRKKTRIPICMVLTKTDCCLDAVENAVRFAETYLPGTMQFCQRRFANFQVFAASVVGSAMRANDEYGGETYIPLHVQPRGIVEPLSWIMQNMGRR